MPLSDVMRRLAKKAARFVPILLLPALILADSASGNQEIDAIAAVVNDDVIVRSELDTRIAELMQQMQGAAVELPPKPVIERQVLESLVAIRLQLQAAQTAGITVDDDTLGRAVQTIAQNNNVSLVELRNVMERDGIPFDRFREQLRQDIIISRLRNQEVVNRVVVTDQEIDNLLKRELGDPNHRSEYHLFHILVATPEGASPEQLQKARSEAESIVGKLRAGSDFQQVALAHSAGRQALEGGDLGWRKASELPSLFTDVIMRMDRGEISDPIQSPSGFHIVKLADYKGGDRLIVQQTHARHILITPNEVTSDSDAENRLRQLRQRIENGDDFSALARSHSDDKASAIKGGDLGWISSGDIAPTFDEEMGKLTVGQTSAPFRTEYGWHIVQVLDRRDYDNTVEARRNQAREEIRASKAEEAYELWLRRLRDEAYVDIRLDKSS